MSDYTPLEEETILEYWQRKQIDTENQLQQELVEHAKTKTQLRTLTSENQELSRQLAEANARYHREVEDPAVNQGELRDLILENETLRMHRSELSATITYLSQELSQLKRQPEPQNPTP